MTSGESKRPAQEPVLSGASATAIDSEPRLAGATTIPITTTTRSTRAVRPARESSF
ncbi:MAG: hypothetical protein AAGF76_14600 [Pseudomonadota bacterium]